MAQSLKLDVEKLLKILETYHKKDCWQKTQNWFKPLKGNFTERAKLLKNIIYTSAPLTEENTKGKLGDFSVLQGDIIKTKAAITNNTVFSYDRQSYSYYVIVPSSCSVQEGRYKWVLLARLWPIEKLDSANQQAYMSALKLESTKLFYFPPIDGVDVGTLGFLAVFEEISYMENSLLQSAKRVASLSEIGWRLLNGFVVNHFTRPPEGEHDARRCSFPKEWRV